MSLIVRAVDASFATMVNDNAAQSAKPVNPSKLVFHRRGDQYFVAEIWLQGETLRRRLQRASRRFCTPLGSHIYLARHLANFVHESEGLSI